jgi:hypothetical protein
MIRAFADMLGAAPGALGRHSGGPRSKARKGRIGMRLRLKFHLKRSRMAQRPERALKKRGRGFDSLLRQSASASAF